MPGGQRASAAKRKPSGSLAGFSPRRRMISAAARRAFGRTPLSSAMMTLVCSARLRSSSSTTNSTRAWSYTSSTTAGPREMTRPRSAAQRSRRRKKSRRSASSTRSRAPASGGVASRRVSTSKPTARRSARARSRNAAVSSRVASERSGSNGTKAVTVRTLSASAAAAARGSSRKGRRTRRRRIAAAAEPPRASGTQQLAEQAEEIGGGDDADQFLAFDHRHRAELPLVHHLHHFRDRSGGRHRHRLFGHHLGQRGGLEDAVVLLGSHLVEDGGGGALDVAGGGDPPQPVAGAPRDVPEAARAHQQRGVEQHGIVSQRGELAGHDVAHQLGYGHGCIPPTVQRALVKHTLRAESSGVDNRFRFSRRSGTRRPEPRLPLRVGRQPLQEQGD